jgi:hypothetical protein
VFYTLLQTIADHIARGNVLLGVFNIDGDSFFAMGTDILNFV